MTEDDWKRPSPEEIEAFLKADNPNVTRDGGVISMPGLSISVPSPTIEGEMNMTEEETAKSRVRRDAMSWATSLHAEQAAMRGPEHAPEAILAAAKLYAEFVLPGSTKCDAGVS